MILRLLSFCYACVVDLPNWSMLHVPLPHPWHWMSCIPLMSRSDAPSQSAKLLTTTDSSWMQAQLSLSRGGLGLRSLAHHSNAAFIASISTAGLASPSDNFLADAVNSYNRCVPPESAIDINSLTSSPCRQHTLSAALENIQFNSLLSQSSVADKARLLSVSSPMPPLGSL